MIQLINVEKTFNHGEPNRFTALRRIELKLDQEQVTLFKGPSGSGKTTLLSIIACMVRPTSGRVWLKDREITGLPEQFLSRIRRDSFGFIFQHFNLINRLTVMENVLIPTYPTSGKLRRFQERALFLLDTLEILSKAYEPVQCLSGGEQQRVAIARAMINDPEIIIADEPTAHLNTMMAKCFLAVVASLKANRKTVLMASHDPILSESSVADRVIELRDGSVVKER